MKDDLIRKILVPLRLSDFNAELIRYVIWYNEHRPHQNLHGRTPNEVYESRFPSRDSQRLEPRPNYPLKARGEKLASTLVKHATDLQQRTHDQSRISYPDLGNFAPQIAGVLDVKDR